MAQDIRESYAPDSRVGAVELPVGDSAHPDLAAVLAYWNGKRGDRIAPPRNAVEPGDLVRYLPRIKLVDVLRGPDGTLDFKFRLAGTAIGTILGTELTRSRPRDLQPPQFGALIHDHYTQCVLQARPFLHRVEVNSLRRFHSYARLLLPLSGDGTTIDMLMTVDSDAV